MKEGELVYLSHVDVVRVGLEMREVISIVEGVFREHALQQVENPPKAGIHPRADAFMHAMPGYLMGAQVAGVKWVSSFPSNSGSALPAVTGLIVLNDTFTGQPLALLDCRWITAARTGAASAAAANLAREGAETLGIVGAGVQGQFNLLGLREVLPSLRVVKVCDRSREGLESFVEEMSDRMPFEFEACDQPMDAIKGADVVVTATGRLEGVIYREEWVKEGALVLPVHHRGWQNELLHKVDKFVTDDWPQLQQANMEVGGFDGPLPPLYAELGQIVVGHKRGRENNRERIIDFNYGIAIEDVAVAQVILNRSRARGLGTSLSLTS